MTSIHQSLIAAGWAVALLAALFAVTLLVLEAASYVAKPRWGHAHDDRIGGTPTPI